MEPIMKVTVIVPDDYLGDVIGDINARRGLMPVSYTHLDVYKRQLLTCQSKHGVCIKCYGANLATGDPVTVGEAVGIIAAQSIGCLLYTSRCV